MVEVRLQFPQHWLRWSLSSGIWRHVVWYIVNILEEPTGSNFRVEDGDSRSPQNAFNSQRGLIPENSNLINNWMNGCIWGIARKWVVPTILTCSACDNRISVICPNIRVMRGKQTPWINAKHVPTPNSSQSPPLRWWSCGHTRNEINTVMPNCLNHTALYTLFKQYAVQLKKIKISCKIPY